MKENKQLTCIGCPMGCTVTVEMEDGKILSVAGNTCKRGEIYARKEVTHPTRIVTSTVRISGGTFDMLPVKTASDVPKDKIFACMKSLDGVTVKAPVRIGDEVVKDAGGTGVSFIATRDVPTD